MHRGGRRDSVARSAMSPGRSRSTCAPLPRSSDAAMRFWQSADRVRRRPTGRLAEEWSAMVFAARHRWRQDLPISLPFALAGGAAALAVSFIVLGAGVAHPALRRGDPGPAAAGARSRAVVDGGGAAPGLRGPSAWPSRRTSAGPRWPGRTCHQPHVRGRLRAAVGGHRAGVAAVRSVLPGGEPAADAAPAAVAG